MIHLSWMTVSQTIRYCIVMLSLLYVAETKPVHAADGRAAPPAWDGRRITELAGQLNADAYESRERASRELAKAPPAAMPVLTQLAQESEDPECAYRLHMAARALFLKWIAPRLPEWGKGRGYLGIAWEMRPKEPGVLVTTVFPNSAADQAGLKADDVILSVNGQRFEKGMTMEDVKPVWRRMLPDDRMSLEVERAGQAAPLNLVAVAGQPPEGKSEFDSGTPSEAEKVDILWLRYRQGHLNLPKEAQALLPGTAATQKLQSWPDLVVKK